MDSIPFHWMEMRMWKCDFHSNLPTQIRQSVKASSFLDQKEKISQTEDKFSNRKDATNRKYDANRK